MEISYLGHSAFKIRGKNAVLVTDPYGGDWVHLKFPRHITADIVTVSHEHQDHNATGNLEGQPVIVRGPGEYEIKGVGIIGIAAFHDSQNGSERGKNTIYRIDIDGISVVHLGDLGHMLNTSQLETLDGVGVLLIPVGGVYTIDARGAVEVIREIDPAIVIPMHFGRPELKEIADVKTFLKEIDREGLSPQPKLTLTKDKLPEEMQVVLLE